MTPCEKVVRVMNSRIRRRVICKGVMATLALAGLHGLRPAQVDAMPAELRPWVLRDIAAEDFEGALRPACEALADVRCRMESERMDGTMETRVVLESGDPEQVRVAAERVASDAKTAPRLRVLAWLLYAEACAREGAFERARTAVADANAVPSTAALPPGYEAALCWMAAHCEEHLGQHQKANRWAMRIIREHPDTEVAESAAAMVARCADVLGTTAEAGQALEGVAVSHDDTPALRGALRALPRLYAKELLGVARLAAAERHLGAYGPESDEATRRWLGSRAKVAMQIAQERGPREAARAYARAWQLGWHWAMFLTLSEDQSQAISAPPEQREQEFCTRLRMRSEAEGSPRAFTVGWVIEQTEGVARVAMAFESSRGDEDALVNGRRVCRLARSGQVWRFDGWEELPGEDAGFLVGGTRFLWPTPGSSGNGKRGGEAAAHSALVEVPRVRSPGAQAAVTERTTALAAIVGAHPTTEAARAARVQLAAAKLGLARLGEYSGQADALHREAIALCDRAVAFEAESGEAYTMPVAGLLVKALAHERLGDASVAESLRSLVLGGGTRPATLARGLHDFWRMFERSGDVRGCVQALEFIVDRCSDTTDPVALRQWRNAAVRLPQEYFRLSPPAYELAAAFCSRVLGEHDDKLVVPVGDEPISSPIDLRENFWAGLERATGSALRAAPEERVVAYLRLWQRGYYREMYEYLSGSARERITQKQFVNAVDGLCRKGVCPREFAVAVPDGSIKPAHAVVVDVTVEFDTDSAPEFMTGTVPCVLVEEPVGHPEVESVWVIDDGLLPGR